MLFTPVCGDRHRVLPRCGRSLGPATKARQDLDGPQVLLDLVTKAFDCGEGAAIGSYARRAPTECCVDCGLLAPIEGNAGAVGGQPLSWSFAAATTFALPS